MASVVGASVFVLSGAGVGCAVGVGTWMAFTGFEFFLGVFGVQLVGYHPGFFAGTGTLVGGLVGGATFYWMRSLSHASA